MPAFIAVETAVLVLLTVLVAGLLRSHADILRRLHALDHDAAVEGVPASIQQREAREGRRAVDISGESLHDEAVHIAVAATRHRTLLAFLSSSCLTCQAFWDDFANVDALGMPADVRVVVVTKDARDESPTALRRLAAPGVQVVMSNAAWNAYAVPGSPYFVMVDGGTGRIEGEGTGATWPQVRNLIVHARGDGARGHDGTAREARIDRELLAHGIGPGDPMLYPEGTRS